MDISDTIIPRSDQLNFDDVAVTPITATVTEVKRGNAEQPVEIHLAETPGRPFKPSKSMRRVLVAAWGKDAQQYVGRRLTLFGDPHVKWAGQEVGGIRISHLSHLSQPLRVALTVTRGKREPYTVQPLPDAPATPVGESLVSDEAIESADVDGLRALWSQASPVQQSRIRERVTELQAEDGDV